MIVVVEVIVIGRVVIIGLVVGVTVGMGAKEGQVNFCCRNAGGQVVTVAGFVGTAGVGVGTVVGQSIA